MQKDNIDPICKPVVSWVDNEGVFEYALQLVSCSCYIRVDRKLCEKNIAYGEAQVIIKLTDW